MSSETTMVAEQCRLRECALFENWNKSHARRRFDEAVKALPKAKLKDSRAYLALTMIQAICREEKQLKELRNSNHVLVTENRPGLRCTSYLIFLSAEVADCVSVGEGSAGCGSNAL